LKNSNKEELYRKWISRKYQILNSSISNTRLDREDYSGTVNEHCRLELEATTHVIRKDTNASISARSKLGQTDYNTNQVRKTSLLLGVGVPGSIRLDDEVVMATCKSKNETKAFIDFSLMGVHSSLSTSVTLIKGQSIDLGSVVEDLKRENRKISLSKGIQLNKRDGNKSKTFKLRIKD
jgi:hypothetical protein